MRHHRIVVGSCAAWAFAALPLTPTPLPQAGRGGRTSPAIAIERDWLRFLPSSRLRGEGSG